MQRILTASKDTYITDKIIGGSFRATDANVGEAGTLDLFKLYGETKLPGTSSNQTELSRILIKFDLDPLRAMTGSTLDITHASFKAYIHLSDVYGGQTTPSNFKLLVIPLSKSFDEGFGRDVGLFQDLDAANFVTASVSQGVSLWNVTGANGLGLLGSADIDAITSGSVGSGVVDLGVTQTFTNGGENLVVNVTRVVSATLAGMIPDHGFRISFSGTQETDTQTRFVKRFSSRHTTNIASRPKMKIYFSDALHDDHRAAYFDVSGTMFLRNVPRGILGHITSGSSLTNITGTNCVILTLASGSFTASFTGSQHYVGVNAVTGVYSSSFFVSSLNQYLSGEITNAGSATFSETWKSLDGTVRYAAGTVVFYPMQRDFFTASSKRFIVNVTNAKKVYSNSEVARFRVFAQIVSNDDSYKSSRLPVESVSYVSRNFYYRIRDAYAGTTIIDFDYATNSTNMSTDKDGMYFDVYMDSLPEGRSYIIDVMLRDAGASEIFGPASAPFRVGDV